MAAVFVSRTKDAVCLSSKIKSTRESTSKSVAGKFPVHLSVATELVIGDPANPVYRKVFAEKQWTNWKETSNATRCQFFQEKIEEFRTKTRQPEDQGRREPGVGLKRRNAVRIMRKDYNIVSKKSYIYPEYPWLLQDDPKGTEMARLEMILAENAETPPESPEIAVKVTRGSLKRRIATAFKRQKKVKKVVVERDEFYFDEEELKKKYLDGLKYRKRFPCVLTYKIPFLRRFRPKDEEENRYSPMAIPDEVYVRYFDARFKNPWDYGGSPLPFWTPPDV